MGKCVVYVNGADIGGEVLGSMTKGDTTIGLVYYIDGAMEHFEYYVLYEKDTSENWVVRHENRIGATTRKIAMAEEMRNHGLDYMHAVIAD